MSRYAIKFLVLSIIIAEQVALLQFPRYFLACHYIIVVGLPCETTWAKVAVLNVCLYLYICLSVTMVKESDNRH